MLTGEEVLIKAKILTYCTSTVHCARAAQEHRVTLDALKLPRYDNMSLPWWSGAAHYRRLGRPLCFQK